MKQDDLRVRFATAALQGELAAQDARYDGKGTGVLTSDALNVFAQRIWQIADAMVQNQPVDIRFVLESLADIAYYAGKHCYYTGDSRVDINNFIAWAKEFESHRVVDDDGNESYFGEPYMVAVEEFARDKMNGLNN